MARCVSGLQFNGKACVCPIMKFQRGNDCVSCSTSNCMYCPDNTCSQCFRGYYLANKACNVCPTNCQYCLKLNTC